MYPCLGKRHKIEQSLQDQDMSAECRTQRCTDFIQWLYNEYNCDDTNENMWILPTNNFIIKCKDNTNWHCNYGYNSNGSWYTWKQWTVVLTKSW